MISSSTSSKRLSQYLLQRGLGSFDGFPAHCRSRHAHRIGYLRNHSLMAPRGEPLQQDLQHALSGGCVSLQCFIDRNRYLFTFTPALPAKPRLVHSQLALLQIHPTSLSSVPADVPSRRRHIPILHIFDSFQGAGPVLAPRLLPLARRAGSVSICGRDTAVQRDGARPGAQRKDRLGSLPLGLPEVPSSHVPRMGWAFHRVL
jgi:hypothetical protein